MRTGYQRAEQALPGTVKSLQRPDREKERQAIHRAGGETQGQDQSPGEKEGAGREGKRKKTGRLQKRESWTEGWRQGEQQGEGDSQTAEDEGRELGSGGNPERPCRDDPCESKEQVQSEKRREAGCLKRAMLQANPEAQRAVNRHQEGKKVTE